jgi:hypothetical protein
MPQQVGAAQTDDREAQIYFVDSCQNCQATEDLEEHHVVPTKNGGHDVPTNKVLLCEACHKAVHYDRTAPSSDQKNRNLGEFGVAPNEGELSEISRHVHRSQKQLADF